MSNKIMIVIMVFIILCIFIVFDLVESGRLLYRKIKKLKKRVKKYLFQFIKVILVILICSFIYLVLVRMLSIFGMNLNEVVPVKTDIFSVVLVKTDIFSIVTELLSTIVTVNLTLFTIAITAYIFLEGALEHRERFEKQTIKKLKRKSRRVLITLSGGIGTTVTISLFFENTSLNIPTYAIYLLVIAELICMVNCMLFIYKMVNYEEELREYAEEELENFLKIDSRETNFGGKSDKTIKIISDTKMLVEKLLENHAHELYIQGVDTSLVERNLISILKLKGEYSEEEIFENAKLYIELTELKDYLYTSGRSISSMVENAYEKALKIFSFFCKFAFTNEVFRDVCLSNVELSKECDFSNSSFWKAAFKQVVFHEANLSGADFSGTVFQGCDFQDANCESTVFQGARFDNTELPMNCTGAVFSKVAFNVDIKGSSNKKYCYTKCGFNQANLIGRKIENVDFSNSILSETLFSNSMILDTIFKYANCQCAIFTNAKITKGTFDNSNLERAVASFSSWNECVFLGARLSAGNFSWAGLKKCDFSTAFGKNLSLINSDIENCIFDDAALNQTDFSYSSIKTCSFLNTDLKKSLFGGKFEEFKERKSTVSQSNFTGANFSGAQIKNCIFDHCIFHETFFDGALLKNVMFVDCEFRYTQFWDATFMNVSYEKCKNLKHKLLSERIRFCTKEDKDRFKKI